MQPLIQGTKKLVYTTLVALHFRVTNASAVLRAEINSAQVVPLQRTSFKFKWRTLQKGKIKGVKKMMSLTSKHKTPSKSISARSATRTKLLHLS